MFDGQVGIRAAAGRRAGDDSSWRVGDEACAHPGFDPGGPDSAAFNFDLLGPDPFDLDPWEALELRSEPRVGAEQAGRRQGADGSGVLGEDGDSFEDVCRPVEPTALLADELAGKSPGADLAYLLERGEPAEADDYALVEAVAGWQRLAAWVAAGAAAAAAELADRPSMNPNWPESAGKVSELNVAGEELAMRLSCSRRAAWSLVREGRAFRGPLAATGDALARGGIDLPRARVLVGALEDVSIPLALEVQDAVLPGAPGRTVGQLRRDVARALIVADPAGAEERCRVARRGRRVDRPKVLPDGMAGLWAVLPAADAVRLDAGIDTLAHGARNAGDPRTLDQLRADLLVDLTLGRFTAPAECVDGDGRRAAGGIGAQGARGVGDDGARGADGVGGQGARGADRVGGQGAGDADDVGGHGARGAPPRRLSARSQIRVTVPMTSLQGAGDDPGELVGYGPITAGTAQDLAADGIWTRLVTDPTTGAVLDVGRTRYRPPAALAEHVRARDRYCARPGCSARAEACDLDHTVEYGRERGETKDDNLGPLCARDHQIKTDGGFALAQVAPGVFEWCTPTGHRYRVTPGADRAVQRLPRSQRPPPF